MKSILTDHPARQVTGLRLGSCTRWGTEEPSDPCTPLQTAQGLLIPDSVPTSSHTHTPHANLFPQPCHHMLDCRPQTSPHSPLCTPLPSPPHTGLWNPVFVHEFLSSSSARESRGISHTRDKHLEPSVRTKLVTLQPSTLSFAGRCPQPYLGDRPFCCRTVWPHLAPSSPEPSFP